MNENDVLILEQCPLCDRYVGWIEQTYGGRTGYGLVYRYDLQGFICVDCATELGPDESRVHCLMLGGCTREEALAMLQEAR